MTDGKPLVHQHDGNALPNGISDGAIVPNERAVKRRIGVLAGHGADPTLTNSLDELFNFIGLGEPHVLMSFGAHQQGEQLSVEHGKHANDTLEAWQESWPGFLMQLNQARGALASGNGYPFAHG